jgi:hypothetical protein
MEIPKHVEVQLTTLRSEADEVKQCFTQFAFQAFVFCSVLLGIAIKELADHPYMGMATLLLSFLLLLVTRVGNYKYSTANRNYGYELHIHRTLYYRSDEAPESTKQLLNLGWEEAMFAWRIVHATLFDTIYEQCGNSRIHLEKKKFKDVGYKWWDTNSLKDGASHHPGSYLQYMHIFLHRLAILAILPAFYSSFYYLVGTWLNKWSRWYYLMGIVFFAITFNVLVFVFRQVKRDNARRVILETGLLSIQASAVVWRAAAVAHFRALENAGRFKGYTRALSKQAIELSDNVENIHEWLQTTDSFPRISFSGMRSVESTEENPGRPIPEIGSHEPDVENGFAGVNRSVGKIDSRFMALFYWIIRRVDDVIG